MVDIQGKETFVTSNPWRKSFIETRVIPRIRNGNRVFVEDWKSRSNLSEPLMIQGKETFVTTIYSYCRCVITRAGGETPSRKSLLSLSLWFPRLTGDPLLDSRDFRGN